MHHIIVWQKIHGGTSSIGLPNIRKALLMRMSLSDFMRLNAKQLWEETGSDVSIKNVTHLMLRDVIIN
jgi:hypothetical protein